jgi:hypothetical protein
VATSANRQPVYSLEAVVSWAVGSIGSQALGTLDLAAATGGAAGAAYDLGFTADATNGGYVQSITIRPGAVGGVGGGGGGTNATIVRLWANNGGAITTSANNALIGEVAIPPITASIAAANMGHEFPVFRAYPPGYKLYATFTVAQTNSWMDIVVWAGKY